jgi:hypothetical protein
MALDLLAPEEREVVRRAMAATFRYFDFDFQTRLGISPDSMRMLLDAWPVVDDSRDDSDACLAINNSMNDLLHGEGISEASVPLASVRDHSRTDCPQPTRSPGGVHKTLRP